jgi:hypothetical protein
VDSDLLGRDAVWSCKTIFLKIEEICPSETLVTSTIIYGDAIHNAKIQ